MHYENRHNILSAAFVAVVLGVFTSIGQGSDVPQGTATINVTTPMPAPAWAVKERELLDINARAIELFEKAYLLPDGSINVTYMHGAGVAAPDDILELVGKMPLLYALGADDSTWRIWWRIWQGGMRQWTRLGIFVNEFEKYLDWHHNGEAYQPFWLAALCVPDDPEYRRQALLFTSYYDGTNPKVPNYDPQRKVIRSMLNGGAGPVLHAKKEDWSDDGKVPDAWVDCAYDSPLNLVTTCFGTNAFLLTGQEDYRRRTLEYINAWRDRAKANGGIIPSICHRDGKVPAEWWGGLMGWDYTYFGGLFQVTEGPRAAWGNALLLTGDASYFDTMRTLVDTLWEKRFTLDAAKSWPFNKPTLTMPRYYGKKGWYGQLGPHSNGVYNSMLANVYLATMQPADEARVKERKMTKGNAGHGNAGDIRNFYEGGYEPEWFGYLFGEDLDWPQRSLDFCIGKVKRQIGFIEKEVPDGPQKLRVIATADSGTSPWPCGWCGPLVNLMTGGIMPLWHGQLHLAYFRYFDPAQQRPGIPKDCAALVEKIGDRSATLVLANLNAREPRTVLVQTGAYAEHQCLSVQAEGQAAQRVESPLFAVRLEPGAGARLMVEMKRYANTPTARLPWSPKTHPTTGTAQ